MCRSDAALRARALDMSEADIDALSNTEAREQLRQFREQELLEQAQVCMGGLLAAHSLAGRRESASWSVVDPLLPVEQPG